MTVRRFLYAEAVFQVVIAVVLGINWDPTVTAFTGHAFAPTRDAAEGAALGALVVHVVLAVVCVVLAREQPKIRTTIVLVLTAVGGVVAMGLPSQTYLSPIGVALAVGGLVALWVKRTAPRPS
jgi:RsiW-degrading membrane proteinase PrsW (M82 family)